MPRTQDTRHDPESGNLPRETGQTGTWRARQRRLGQDGDLKKEAKKIDEQRAPGDPAPLIGWATGAKSAAFADLLGVREREWEDYVQGALEMPRGLRKRVNLHCGWLDGRGLRHAFRGADPGVDEADVEGRKLIQDARRWDSAYFLGMYRECLSLAAQAGGGHGLVDAMAAHGRRIAKLIRVAWSDAQAGGLGSLMPRADDSAPLRVNRGKFGRPRSSPGNAALRELRRRLGEASPQLGTQEGFAARIGMTVRSLEEYEQGVRKVPEEVGKRIGRYFGVDEECLIAKRRRKGRYYVPKTALRSADKKPFKPSPISASGFDIERHLGAWSSLFARAAKDGRFQVANTEAWIALGETVEELQRYRVNVDALKRQACQQVPALRRRLTAELAGR
jgi:transcriptional regulator with XRE-family HTH domain